MMHRFGIVLFCVTLIVTFAIAQDQQEEETFTRPGKFGGGLGVTTELLYPDVSPINDVLLKNNSPLLSSGPMVLYGGQIYGYILFVQNLRTGFQWGSGSLHSNGALSGVSRDVEFGAHFYGFPVEYAFSVRPRLDLTVGVMLGWGGVDLTINRDNGGAKQWDSIWSQFGTQVPPASNNSQYTKKMSGTFFIYEPSLNIEYAVLRWLGLRAGVGYQGMAGGNWSLDNKFDLYNVPSNVTGKGLTINTGIFIGTFIF